MFNLAERIQAAQPPLPRDIETITGEILDAKRAGGEAILTIGKGLMEAKALLSHGEWLPWLEERVEFSEKAAQRFMRLAREYSNPTALSDLGATKALMLLALPPEQREEFIEATHVVDGEEKTVIDMTSREMERVIKERDQALKAAEQAREKMAQDMALANERIAGLNATVEAQSAKAREAQDAAARLERELAELRARPVDVAVEVDAAAVEAARKEAEAAMRAKLDKAQRAKAEAEEARKAAEDARAEAQQELERVKAEAAAIRAKAEARTAITADAELVLFRELYEQSQTVIKRMGGLRMKRQNKDPGEAQRLSNALLALIDVVKEAAGQ